MPPFHCAVRALAVARQAGRVDVLGRHRREDLDLGLVARLGVLLAGAVAGLAGLVGLRGRRARVLRLAVQRRRAGTCLPTRDRRCRCRRRRSRSPGGRLTGRRRADGRPARRRRLDWPARRPARARRRPPSPRRARTAPARPRTRNRSTRGFMCIDPRTPRHDTRCRTHSRWVAALPKSRRPAVNASAYSIA